jgi:hypothetical protein
MSATRTAILLAAAAFVLGGTASPVRAADPAPAPAWNQKEVLRLAEELAAELDQADAASRAAPPQATALQQRTRDAAANSFHRVHDAAADFAKKLRQGRDRETTEAHFKNVRTAFENTRKIARDAVATPDVDQHLRRASELIQQLARFYPHA